MLNRLLRYLRKPKPCVSCSRSSVILDLEQLEGRDVPARVWYIAPNGLDYAPGTYGQPMATLAAVEWQLSPGDEVHFRAGTYRLTDPIDLYKSGTAAATIKVMAEPGETVILDGGSLPNAASAVVNISGNYVEVNGLQVINAPHTGIAVWGGSHDVIRNNTVRDSQGSGIYVGFDHAGVVSDVLVQGNTVTHNSLWYSARNLSGGWTAAVVAQYTSGVKFLGNSVFKNYGEGFNVLLSDGTVVQQNTAYDNFSANYYLDNATNAIVDGNLSYTTSDAGYFRFGLPAVGMQLANEPYAGAIRSYNDRITNNILLGGRFGFYYGNYGLGGGLLNLLFAGNTIYGSMSASLHIDGDLHFGTVIENNIVEQHRGYAMVDYNGADGLGGLTFRTNLWYGGTPEIGAGPGDVNADPRFVNPYTNDPAGFRLRADSPALDRGTWLTTAPNDFFGTVRQLTPFDIGATEFIGLGTPSGDGFAANGSTFARGATYRLTDTTSANQAGTLFTEAKVGVASFSTTFAFQITSPYADGLTFTLQNAGATALGISGGGLGYQGIAKSVAIKFDIYNNAGEGSNSLGVYTAGQAPTLGATDLTPSGIDLHNGHIFQARLDYDGYTLSVVLTDTATGATFSRSYLIDIPGTVGGSTAYVGFTAGTGGLKSITDILSWSYSPGR